jgi:hypothetical protein
MNSGGNVLKLFFTLTALFLLISMLLFQTDSFTQAEITSEAILSIVSEDNALIAIIYGKGKMFAVTNNAGKTVEIESVELIGDSKNSIIEVKGKGTSLQPGGNKEFNITADPKKLPGKVIQLIVRWEGGSAEIKSTIPEAFIEQLQIEVEKQNEQDKNIEQDKEKQVKEQTKLEKDEEPVVEEPVNPEVVDELVNPEAEEEPVKPEEEEEPVNSEIEGEQSNPVVDEDK